MIKNIIHMFYNPKKVFQQVNEKPDTAHIIVIIAITNILFSLQFIFIPEFAYSTNSNSLLFFYSLSMFTFGCIGQFSRIIMLSLWLTICFKLIDIKPKFKQVLSVMTYSELPLIINYSLILIWPSINVFVNNHGKYERLYLKTSLASIFIDYYHTHPLLFKVFSFFEMFTMATFVFEIIAVTVIAKITIKRAVIILFPYWIIMLIGYLV